MMKFLLTGLFMLMAGTVYADPEPWFPPGAPPAKILDCVDASTASRDDKLLLTSLQGLVNRGPEAKLWLKLSPWDSFWLAHLQEATYITAVNVLSIDAALTKYAPSYQQVILYDPTLPASINVATMMGSLQNGIVANPDRLESLKPLGKEILDLRGRWKNNVEAYRWAFESLWPQMNHGLLACYHPSATDHHLRDYLVRNQVFHFWVTSADKADGITANHDAEMTLLRDILAKTPVNIPVIGFWYSGADSGVDEYPGVGLAGEYGKITVVCDWATNLSVLSGVPVDLPKTVQQYRARLAQTPLTPEPDKVYLAIDIVESGDSPSYLETRQQDVWKDPKRGSIPINWSMGPAILDLAPPIAAYYYQQATPNDYLYTSISGAGYCHPYRALMRQTPTPDRAWDDYLARTQNAMRRMGCAELGLYTDAWKPFDRTQHDPVTLRFIQGIPEVRMLVLGMGRDEGINAANGTYYLGSPQVMVSHILTRWPVDYAKKRRDEQIEWLVQDIRAQTPASRPAFLHVMALSWAYGPAEITDVLQHLGQDYIPLTLPAFAECYRDFNAKK